jgi:hypothetical protein
MAEPKQYSGSAENVKKGAYVPRTLPDQNACRTKPLGIARSLARCLVDRPIGCPYVMFSDGAQLCKSPSWEKFVRE